MRGARPLLPLAACLLLTLPVALAAHDHGSGPRSLGGRTVPLPDVMLRIEAEDFEDKRVGSAVEDAGATGGRAWRMERYGVIATTVSIPESGVVWVHVRAKGWHPDGMMSTHMHPNLDGRQRGEWDMSAEWVTYTQAIPMLAGEHVLDVDNFNNYHAAADDRTLVVDWVELRMPTLEGSPRVGGSAPASVTVDGPDVHAAGTGMARADDAGARGGTSWHMWGIGCFVESVVLEEGGDLALHARLRGNAPDGVGSRTTILVDGQTIDELHVGDEWVERTSAFSASSGAHVLEICYDNDYGGDQKRNLWLDEMTIELVEARADATPTRVSPTPGNLPPATPTPPTTGQDATPDEPPAPSPDESARTVPAPAGLAAVAAAALLRRSSRPPRFVREKA